MWENDEILSNYKGKMNKYKYISFDIFDTLLLRTVEKPEDIFLKLGEEAIKNKYVRSNLTSFEFKQIRILSEKAAFEKKRESLKQTRLDNEVNLIDIYNEMPETIGNIQEIIKLEVEVEKKHTYLNLVMYDFLKYLKISGKKIFLISNMYLSKDIVRDILISNKFDYELIDELIVSCDEKLNKNTGKLFRHVIDKYNINPKEIIHIGDNYDSDIQGAKKAGIDSIKYDVVVEANTAIDIEGYKYGKVLPELKSLRKSVRNLTATYIEEEKFWYKFGAGVIGPILTLFCDEVIERAMQEDIKVIKPFMREGVILEPLLKKAAENREYVCSINSLYLSRLSTLMPSIDKISINKLDEIFDIKNIKFKNVINILGLDLEDIINYNYYFDLYCSEIDKENIKIITKYIIDNYSEKINKFIVKKRDIFINYLKQEKVIDNKVITVDLGFAGSVQERIEDILYKQKIDINMIHMIAVSSEKLYGRLQKGINIQSFTGIYEENIELNDIIIDKVMLLEELMMDERGSTLDYEQSSNYITPVLDSNKVPVYEHKYKEVCREGILKFQEIYYSSFADKKILVDIKMRKTELLNIIARFMKCPIYEESINLSKLHHEDNFGTSSVETICTKRDFEIYESMGKEEFLLKAKHKGVIWPEAIITLNNPMYIQKKVIRESYNMPRYYKEVIYMIENLIDNNVNSIIVWGAGEVGQVCLKMLHKYGIEVLGVIDRKEWLWGSYIEQVKVSSLENVFENYKNTNTNILIASFGFADEIEKAINTYWDDATIYTMI
ncbi:HAD-IA family hydrolase [Clostridium saccharoperbutylacetonicum]|uniref:HAD-IA family hydrolase n=1 Tax=Clostridium saccharoperbutylacetonicum TaxID=36745 RepID=UPI0039EA3D97